MMSYIRNNKTIRNSSSNLINKSLLNEENLISQRIKIFNPKKSYIKEINNKTSEIMPVILNESSFLSNINDKNISNNLIKYFGLYNRKKKAKIKQRNSFSFIRILDLNKKIIKDNNDIKYQTIQNKKELINKNFVKKNNKKILRKKNANHKYKYTFNKTFEEVNNKKIYEIFNSDNDDNIKTPKKEEDNIKINPKILIERLQKELNSFNKGFIYQNKKIQ
jgi:hypothetical protein